MECWEARRIYAEVINNRTPIGILDNVVREHLRDCPDCSSLLRRLVQVVAAPGNGCAAVRPQLVAYAEAELQGEGNQPQFADVRLHLDVCVDCALDFALVTQSLTGAPAETRQLLTPTPAVDLTFLSQRAAPAAEEPDWGQLWQTALHWEGPRQVILQLSAALLSALTGLQQSAGIAATRAGARSPSLWQLEVPDEQSALQIVVTAERERRNPAYVDLFFTIGDAERGGWPNLAGITLECRWGEQAIQRVMTDAFGKAVVAGIPADELATLTITIDATTEA